jgi:hypothetical protein
MDFGPEPVGEQFDDENSLEEEDQNGGLGEEDEEEIEEEGARLFDAAEDFEHSDENSILSDVLRQIDHPRSPGNRYIDRTPQWASELLWTCGTKALKMIRDEFSLRSYHALSQRPPSGYVRSDLTGLSLVVARVRAWRNNLRGKIPHGKCPRCALACDALACKPSVEVAAGGLGGTDVRDFDFESELSESLLASPKAVLDFTKTHWDRVLQAVFVFQIQPLDPDFRPFLVFAHPAADGKAREQHTQFCKN